MKLIETSYNPTPPETGPWEYFWIGARHINPVVEVHVFREADFTDPTIRTDLGVVKPGAYILCLNNGYYDVLSGPYADPEEAVNNARVAFQKILTERTRL